MDIKEFLKEKNHCYANELKNCEFFATRLGRVEYIGYKMNNQTIKLVRLYDGENSTIRELNGFSVWRLQ